jgi:hypothetical protein
MSNAEIAIYEKLKDLNSGRIYPLRAPDNLTQDFIVYQRLDSDRWRSINAPSGMVQASIQLDCYSQSYYNVKSMASTVETRLDGFRGSVPYGTNSPQDEVRVGGIVLETDSDLAEITEEPFMYRVTMTFNVTYEQE